MNIETTPAEPVVIPPSGRSRPICGDLTELKWNRIAWGIGLAGSAYAATLQQLQSTFTMVILVWSGFGNQFGGSESVWMAGAMMVSSVFQAWLMTAIGGGWAVVVAAVTLPIVYLFVWSLRIRGSAVWLGAFCGGLVAFLATLPMIVFLTGEVFSDADVLWPLVMMLLFGPGLATVVGQIGGAWGGNLAAMHQARMCGHTASVATFGSSMPANLSAPESELAVSEGDPPPRLQFRIHHIMWIALWLSVLLTVIRLCGVPFELMLPLILGWSLYQAATLWIGSRLGEWSEIWRPWRRPIISAVPAIQ